MDDQADTNSKALSRWIKKQMHRKIMNEEMDKSGKPNWMGKAQYCWPPLTKKFGSAASDIGNIIYFFTQ